MAFQDQFVKRNIIEPFRQNPSRCSGLPALSNHPSATAVCGETRPTLLSNHQSATAVRGTGTSTLTRTIMRRIRKLITTHCPLITGTACRAMGECPHEPCLSGNSSGQGGQIPSPESKSIFDLLQGKVGRVFPKPPKDISLRAR